MKMNNIDERIVYEDNHIIIINKLAGELVQGDKTGDKSLADKTKEYIKKKYNKPGNVFLGVVHRLDRPVSGLVILAKTSKSLVRLNKMLKEGKIKKTYLAIVEKEPPKQNDILIDYLLKNQRQNKTYIASKTKKGVKEAKLKYRLIGKSNNYFLLEVEIFTGRHHQIRAQLSNIGCVIKGDLKYGAKRSNPDGGIDLLAYKLEFVHPVKKEKLTFFTRLPNNKLWSFFADKVLNK